MQFFAEVLSNWLAGESGRDWPEWLQWTVALTLLMMFATGLVWLWVEFG